MTKVNYSESWIDTYNQYLGSINFTEGDFDGLKSVIREYVVSQNPEGYNDWQESSEVGMFVNAIAYLGENINYRVDLNVNDLFPSTTERKQSLLNFTKMLSYSSKRNICANGLAKLVSVSTTQDVTDTSGTMLKGVTIKWNDSSNEDWMEQFLTILNSAFVYTNQFGKPVKTVSINNVSNQLYQLNSAVNSSCVYPFSATINTTKQNFEVVNPNIDVDTNSLEELTPIPERMFQLLYRNDGSGNSSKNTGFFVYWKQGSLGSQTFNFNEKKVNNYISLATENVNNDDVWFEELDADTDYVSKVWTKIPASEYLSYTSTDNDTRTIFKVETEENDKITVRFADGYFGDIPYGYYRLWYRTSNGNDGLYIKPSDISNISVSIPYFSNTNTTENNVYYLTLTFSVADASHIRQSVQSESIESIRENASAVYSTQDRMVSAQDYNYFPKSIGQNIKVLKSILRTYAGNSRFVDINDPTGSYTPVNVLATDGYMYSSTDVVRSSVALGTLEADEIYYNYIEPKITSKEISNLYYQYYNGAVIPADSSTETLYYYWCPTNYDSTLGVNTLVGGFVKLENTDSYDVVARFDKGSGSVNVLNDISNGDMICFQEYTIDDTNTEHETTNYIWAKINLIKQYISAVETYDNLPTENLRVGDVYQTTDTVKYYMWNGSSWEQTTAITINGSIVSITEILDTNKKWKIRKIYNEGVIDTTKYSKLMNFTTTIDSDIVEIIIDKLSNTDDQTTFGLTYIQGDSSTTTTGGWAIVEYSEDHKLYLMEDELKMVRYSDLSTDKDVANWLIRVSYDSETQSWIIDSHETSIVFGSKEEASFFFNTSNKDASNSGYFITEDTIKIMKNQEKDYDFVKDYYYKPYNVIKYSDGYVDTQEFKCEAYDGDKDSVIDVPTQYNEIVEGNLKDIIFVKSDDSSEDSEMNYLDHTDLKSIYDESAISSGSSTINHEAFKCSLWERTTETGYFYCYHRINEVIAAENISKQILEDEDSDDYSSTYKTSFYTPIEDFITLSNGQVESWSTMSPTTISEGGLVYDFVDYIMGYVNNKPVFYDDVLLADGETTTTVTSISYVSNKYSGLPEASSYDEGSIVEVLADENYDGETTFYKVTPINNTNGYVYYGKQIHGYLYYYNGDTKELIEYTKDEDYEVVKGISDLTFLWKHYPTTDYVIDPCATNIVDMFVLTNTYYNEVQEWIDNGKVDTFPKAPSAYELKSLFSSLESNKMISDNIVWHPVTYKLVFGQDADTDTHCIFKVIKSDELTSDNEVKKQVIQVIDTFFKTMDVGETFYFTQLSTYIQNQLPTLIKTVVIVPTDTTNKFGNLFQINCNENEILLSSAVLDDVQIISSITSQNIRIS